MNNAHYMDFMVLCMPLMVFYFSLEQWLDQLIRWCTLHFFLWGTKMYFRSPKRKGQQLSENNGIWHVQPDIIKSLDYVTNKMKQSIVPESQKEQRMRWYIYEHRNTLKAVYKTIKICTAYLKGFSKSRKKSRDSENNECRSSKC